MVSPVHPSEVDVVSRIALRALGLPDNPMSVGTSVIALPEGMGYAVTVVALAESLTVHLIRVDSGGNTAPLFGGDQA